MTTAVFYNMDQYHDLAATSCIQYNIICFKKDVSDHILRIPVVVGAYTFIPGRAYKKFGKPRKNAAYTAFDCEEDIIFYGRYKKEYLLFTQPDLKDDDYVQIFYGFCLNSAKHDELFTITRAQAFRIIDMSV